jgi:acyl carrier protein
VGAEESFFELGGHSLLATRVISRLRQAFGVEVPLRALFESPTVAGLAAAVERLRRAGGGLEAPPIEPVPRDGNLPLSFAQQRLWLIDQLAPGSPVYNQPAAIRCRGRLVIPALALALEQVIRRHETLRTVIVAGGGDPTQEIAQEASVALPLIDLSNLRTGAQEIEAYRLAADEAARPFDLASGPLLRVCLARLTEAEHLFLFNLHHVVSDGWSIDIFVREVGALYRAGVAGEPADLPALPVQYADYAVWQRRWLRGDVEQAESAYWRRRLAGLPPVLDLPTDRPRPPMQRFRGARRQRRLGAGTIDALHRLGRAEGATSFMVFLGSLMVLLARSARRTDIAVGAPVAGRNRLEIEPLIGFFVNTLVLRAAVEDFPFRTLLSRVRQGLLEAYEHQDLPFEKLVEELRPQRSAAYTPVFQVMFVLQETPLGMPALPDLEMERLEVETGWTKFDLTFTFEKTGDGLSAALDYATDLFDAPSVERMLGHLETLLVGIARAPGDRVSALPLLSEAESHQVLVAWNDPACDLPLPVTQLLEPSGDNRSIYLLDEGFRPLPARVIGEVWIGGASLSPDRLGRPELIAESFLPDPFSGVPGARMYRTGESARRLPTGDLALLPRDEADRRARASDAPPAMRQPVAPRDPVEEALVALWADLLGIDAMGVTDDFFELGGHSLLAVRLMMQLRKIFKVDLPMRIAFEASTVERLASVLLAHEARPGQTLRVARTLLAVQRLSADELSAALATQKRDRA